jgi:hypothetical protein
MTLAVLLFLATCFYAASLIVAAVGMRRGQNPRAVILVTLAAVIVAGLMLTTFAASRQLVSIRVRFVLPATAKAAPP